MKKQQQQEEPKLVEAEVVSETKVDIGKTVKVVDDSPISFGKPVTNQALIDLQLKEIKNLEGKIIKWEASIKNAKYEIILCKKRIKLYEKASSI